jgi:hypothetical protein
MSRNRFTNEKFAFALQSAANGAIVNEASRKMGVSEPMLCRHDEYLSGVLVPYIR